ncbi:bifunctional hydroxymethylpyrimidine kinase/phosphomethylpyrimidine kinase [Alphaproteobacteria bacterium]|jgi:pyridoxine kinase|nr:bifunctional hydroxymethylpyrimidine kinase/phosphomethylpyrimidine kinase [Alphaproteobacteria bacterium]
MKKIITIQSTVLNDLVGNQAASLILGNLSYQVLQIPTIILSSHKGNKNFIEIPIKHNTPQSFFNALKKLYTFNNATFLVGYVPNRKIGNSVIKIIRGQKKVVVDPVMGDTDTGIYVSQDVIKFLPKIIEQASHISLNFFEWSILTNKDYLRYDFNEIAKDAKNYCIKNNKILFIRSIIGKNKILINMIVSNKECFYIETPNVKFKKRVDGAGDISTALFTHYIFTIKDLNKTLELTTNQMFNIIKKIKNNKIAIDDVISKKEVFKFKTKSLNNL